MFFEFSFLTPQYSNSHSGNFATQQNGHVHGHFHTEIKDSAGMQGSTHK